MKKLLLIAFTTALGASLTFAAQTPSTPAQTNPPSKTSSTAKTKKHHNKKQASKNATASSTTSTATKSK